MGYKKLIEIASNILELVNFYCQNKYDLNDFVPLEYRFEISRDLHNRFGYQNVEELFNNLTIGDTSISILESIVDEL